MIARTFFDLRAWGLGFEVTKFTGFVTLHIVFGPFCLQVEVGPRARRS